MFAFIITAVKFQLKLLNEFFFAPHELPITLLSDVTNLIARGCGVQDAEGVLTKFTMLVASYVEPFLQAILVDESHGPGTQAGRNQHS